MTASALARAEGLLRFAEASEEAPAPHADDFDEADGDFPRQPPWAAEAPDQRRPRGSPEAANSGGDRPCRRAAL